MSDKICIRCGEIKPLIDFHNRKKSKDGRCASCKECINSRDRDRYHNKDEYSKPEQEVCKTGYKKCRRCGGEKSLLDGFYKRKDYKDRSSSTCKDCTRELDRKNYKEKHGSKKIPKTESEKKENRNKKHQRWAKKNPNKIKEYERNRQGTRKEYQLQYYYEVIKLDPLKMFARRIRISIRTAFVRRGKSKKARTSKYLGCSFKELYTHLVLSAINNYGLYLDALDYHIDHIIPMATAKTEEDVIKLNHYNNLQLLYPSDNLTKSDSLGWCMYKIEESLYG